MNRRALRRNIKLLLVSHGYWVGRDLEHFEILTSLEEFCESKFSTSPVESLHRFKHLYRRTHSTRFDHTQENSSQANSRFKEIDVSTDFLGFTVHLEVCCVVMVGEKFDGVGGQSFIAQNEEETVFF